MEQGGAELSFAHPLHHPLLGVWGVAEQLGESCYTGAEQVEQTGQAAD